MQNKYKLPVFQSTLFPLEVKVHKGKPLLWKGRWSLSHQWCRRNSHHHALFVCLCFCLAFFIPFIVTQINMGAFSSCWDKWWEQNTISSKNLGYWTKFNYLMPPWTILDRFWGLVLASLKVLYNLTPMSYHRYSKLPASKIHFLIVFWLYLGFLPLPILYLQFSSRTWMSSTCCLLPFSRSLTKLLRLHLRWEVTS